MRPYSKVASIVLLGAAVAVLTNNATAQCTTCATPVVAYSPVVAPAATVTYQPVTGWYPGKLIDTWRMRRWGYTAPTTVTAAYAPTYSVGYAPTYTAAYAPTVTTAAYAPYTVGYAPAVTPSYSMPYVTSYAPLGQRQVLMRPVVVESPVVAATSVLAPACSACSVEAPCNACSACDSCSSCAPTTSVVEQATYTQAAPCTNCAQGTNITYANQAPASSTQTPRPEIAPQEAPPQSSNYPITPPGNEATNPQTPDPGPAAEEKPANSTYFEPPALFNPGDRTAQETKPINRAPSVNVWNAVYTDGASDNVSTTSYKPTTRSQAEIDAQGWGSVTE